MDKKELWYKIRDGFEKGYVVTKEVAVKSAKTVVAYAGPASQLTKVKYNELKVNRQLAKEFAILGHRVYELSDKKKNGEDLLLDAVIKKSLEKSRELDATLHKAQDRFKSEKKKLRELSNHKAKKNI